MKRWKSVVWVEEEEEGGEKRTDGRTIYIFRPFNCTKCTSAKNTDCVADSQVHEYRFK